MRAPFNTLSIHGLKLRTRELCFREVFAQEFSELVSPYKYVTDERNTRRRSESPGRQLRKELSLGAVVVVVVPRPSMSSVRLCHQKDYPRNENIGAVAVAIGHPASYFPQRETQHTWKRKRWKRMKLRALCDKGSKHVLLKTVRFLPLCAKLGAPSPHLTEKGRQGERELQVKLG